MKRALFFSFCIHSMIFTSLLVTGILSNPLYPTSGTLNTISINLNSSIRVEGEISSLIQKYQSNSPKKTLAELKSLVKKSQSISENSLDEIGNYLGLDSTPYNKNDRNLPFALNSSTIFNITKKIYEGGKVGYITTLIDSKGTTLDVHTPPDEVTSDMEMQYKVMSVLNSNPALKQLTLRFLGKMSK